MGLLSKTKETMAARRTLAEFPAYQTELKKLAEFQRELDEWRATLKRAEAEEARGRKNGVMDASVSREANSRLVGKAATETLHDIKHIIRQVRVSAEVVRLQEPKVEASRQAAAKEIAADFLADDKIAVLALANRARQFIESVEALDKLRSEYRAASGDMQFVSPPLRDLSLNKRTLGPLKADLGVFIKAVTDCHYTEGV